ncbi:MAG: GDSL-type esterase/lipase family protein [Thermodesulfovibrionales bacterium]|nr:GDSL-type esterase/lipase family protein [Thermodesulfovibrionales bacterium]
MGDKRLMFIGDSLTEYYDWHLRFPDYRVYNLGISGERVEELYERLPKVVSKIKEVDFIFLMTGINNIAMEDYDLLNVFRLIIKTLTLSYKDAKVVLQSLLPVNLYWIDNRQIEALNRSLKDIAEEYGAEYLDIYSLFITKEGKANPSYLLTDGVHVSNRGYEVWAKAVEEYLNRQS